MLLCDLRRLILLCLRLDTVAFSGRNLGVEGVPCVSSDLFRLEYNSQRITTPQSIAAGITTRYFIIFCRSACDFGWKNPLILAFHSCIVIDSRG